MTHEDYERAANHWKIKDRITPVHWQPEAVNLSE